MPYLNLDPNYPDHPKTVRLMAWLGEFADAIPVRLWSYCARIHPKDGALKGYSGPELESILKWRGAQNKCVEAMIAVGFLKRLENGFACVDWRQHQGHIEAFSRRGKAANKARWDKYRSGILQASNRDAPRNPPSLPALPALPAIKRFVPPTIEEVKAYCFERGKGIDPQKWWDYYTSNGWKVGRNSMKDWQAAIRTWERNGNGTSWPKIGGRIAGTATPVPGKYDGI